MTPIAVILILVAVLLIVVGFRGKQDNLITGLVGRPYGKTNLA